MDGEDHGSQKSSQHSVTSSIDASATESSITEAAQPASNMLIAPAQHPLEGPFSGLQDSMMDSHAQRTRPGVGHQFPKLLYIMLSRADSDGYASICSWRPHGRAFCIHNRDAFVARILPLYFRQTRFASFQRQLNLYGFYRMKRKGPDYRSYYQENFLRGRPDLAESIQRQKLKGEDEVRIKMEPDFSKMDAVGMDEAPSAPACDPLPLRREEGGEGLYKQLFPHVHSLRPRSLFPPVTSSPFLQDMQGSALSERPPFFSSLSTPNLFASSAQGNNLGDNDDGDNDDPFDWTIRDTRYSSDPDSERSPALQGIATQMIGDPSPLAPRSSSDYPHRYQMSTEEVAGMARFLEDVDLDSSPDPDGFDAIFNDGI